jgi:hypothetical protein
VHSLKDRTSFKSSFKICYKSKSEIIWISTKELEKLVPGGDLSLFATSSGQKGLQGTNRVWEGIRWVRLPEKKGTMDAQREWGLSASDSVVLLPPASASLVAGLPSQ